MGPPLMIGGSGPRLLRLTAQYADLWNTGYLAYADSLHEPLAALHNACTQIGRDPASLATTVLISLAYPDLAPPEAWMDQYISGSIEEIAAALAGYRQLGVSHLMIHVGPYTVAAVQRLAEAVQRYRTDYASA